MPIKALVSVDREAEAEPFLMLCKIQDGKT